MDGQHANRLNQEKKHPRHPVRIGIAVCLILTVIGTATALFLRGEDGVQAIALPVYPETGAQRLGANPLDPMYLGAIQDFAIRTAAVLAGGTTEENHLYAPLSLWFAMGISADCAVGPTRDELLQVMAVDAYPAEWITRQGGHLFRRLYGENEYGWFKPMNALWLDKGVAFHQAFLTSLAEQYFVESYGEDFTDPDAGRRIGDWITERTGGRLDVDVTPSPETVLSLVNVVSFSDQWQTRFDAAETKPGPFRLADGGVIEVPFMNRTDNIRLFLAEDGYTASRLEFKNGGSMVLVLPDEDQTPQSVLANPDWMKQIVDPQEERIGEVVLRIPRFDLRVEVEGIQQALETLGVEAAFDRDRADFSLLSDSRPLWIGDISQSVRVGIDEIGCVADAYTQVTYYGAARSEDRCELILDRPFLFLLLSRDHVPVVIGTVNNPLGG